MSVSTTENHKFETIDPDARLMLRVRDGDASAFEEIVRRYQARLITVLQNLMNNRELAEDLAQDVFLRAFRARANYRPDAKFSTWIFTIANNVAKNAKRSRARRKEVNVIEDSGPQSANALESLAEAASGMMPARRADKAERAEMVRLALDSLNERQRMAVLLSKFEGMGYVDIAATMEMSVPAIKSLLTRARDNLRTVLEPYMQEGELPIERS